MKSYQGRPHAETAHARTTDKATRPRIRELWPYAREHRRLLGAAVVLSVAAAGVSLAQPLVVGGIIAAVSDGRSWGGMGWALVGLLAVEVGVGTMQYYLLHRTAEGVVLGARTDLIRHVLRLPISEYRRRDVGDLVSRVGSDTTLLRGALTEGLVDALGGVFVLVGALAAMLLLDPVLAGVTVTVTAIVVAVSLLVGNRLRKLMFDTQSRLGDLTGDLTQTLSAVTVVRANGATERAQARLDDRAAAAFAVGVRAARSSAAIQPLGRAAGQASLLIVLGIGGYRVAAGHMTVAELVTFVLFMFLFMGPVNVGFAAVQSVAGALGALQRITEIRRVPIEDAADTIRHRALPNTVGPMLQFQDVHFAYTPGHAVLNGVSVSVERGSRTAVVGPSGAGKTTLLALIERFYDTDRGRIAIGGIDITELPRAVLREQIGYVEQNSPAVAGSIRDNLTFGAPHVSDERCRAALKAVDLLSRVDAEPRGLDAQIGENGVRLSGGERQRLALARVLLAEPPLLLLDEPTSSLDSRNEEIFQIALDATASDQTVLIVAHRLATVKNADQIVLLDSGRISAVGTHDELLTSSPLYRELARHQMIGAPNR